MKTIKGPAIFLAQFADDKPPFNRLSDISKWAAGLGYKGVQIPTWDARLFDLKRAAESRKYCDEILETLAAAGVQLTELSTDLQGQLVAVHPAYDAAFDGFAPESVRGNPVARQAWAVEQLLFAAKASANLGVKAHATFSGALAWPYVYPWPQRPQGLIETAFEELAKRWRPILDAFDAAGVDLCFELHPGEDLHDGVTFDRFLDCLGGHNRCNILYDPSHFVLQQLDYLAFRNIRCGRGSQPANAGACGTKGDQTCRLNPKSRAKTGGCVLAWWEAGRARLLVPCIALPRAWTTATSWLQRR